MAKVQMQVVQVQVQVQVVKEELHLAEFSKESNLLDLEQLFRSVEHVLSGATTFAENCLQGLNKTVKHKSGPALTSNLISPLGLLKQISCKVNCMILDDTVAEIINDRNVLAEKVLKGYKGPAGAVLSLAAFALDYGELWHYYNSPNDMVKAMAELRRLSFCTDPYNPRSKPLSDLNDLVRQTLDLVSGFYDFKNLRETIPDGMDFSVFEEFMSRYVEDEWCYLATQTVIACMVQFTYLLNRIEKKLDLSNIKSNLDNVLTQLEVNYTAFKKQIETERAYRDLTSIFDKPTGTMEVMKRFIYCGGWTDEYWICNGNGQKVRMEEELRDKKILLLISDLTIKKEEIRVLYSQIYKHLDKSEYEMVWIPIEEEWRDDKKIKYESVRSEMRWCYWYTESYETIPAIRYVREEWHYSGSEPMVMFIDYNGSVKSKVEFHEIDTFGIKAFPFIITSDNDKWDHVPPFFMKISSVKKWVEEESFFLLYGGKKCSKWTKELVACEKKGIRCHEVGSSHEKESKELIGKFWIYMEKLFQACQQQQKESVWKEILRLVSCRDKSGWALLYKGPTILMGGHVKATLNALDTIQIQYSSNWEVILGENKFDKKILVDQHPCLFLESRGFSVWETESMECHCGKRIERVTMLRCCHGRTNHENGPC